MASGWTAPALAAALSVLIAAVCAGAVQLVKTYATVVNILEGLHRVGIPVRGAHGYPSNTQVAAAAPVGGGAQAQQQLPSAAWSQLTDQQMRGSAAGAAAQDCAEECAALACQEIKRVPVPAEYLRWLWFGSYDDRLATGHDLVGMLACVDIRSHERSATWEVAQAELRRAFDAGLYSCILGFWISLAERHWMLVVQAAADGLVARDPWTGTLRRLSWTEFQARYAGEYVHIDQAADVDRIIAA